MRYLPKRARGARLLVVSAAAGAVLLAGAAIAIAAYPQDSVTVYTGCLSTGGAGGNINDVAVGSSPTKACGPGDVLIHLSGGTVTKVSAGTGLTGGGDNGYVTMGIDPKYQLPQSGCSSGQFVASDGSGGWSCQSQKAYSGSDFALSNQSCDTGQFVTGFDSSGRKQCGADQTYGNGTGLELSGNTFSLGSGYQLPQGCSSGQVATSNGDNTWSCHASVGSVYVYEKYWSAYIGDNSTSTASAFCDNGDPATGGGWSVDGNAGINDSGPSSGTGWYATASVPFDFGFGEGNVYVYVKCLHIG